MPHNEIIRHVLISAIMAKNDFKDYICRPYCMFFNEGEKEEMLCRGAHVLEQLVTLNRRALDKALLHTYKKNSLLWKKHDECLRMYVCQHCAFQANDCDFYAEGLSDDIADYIEPCGGFILLAYLKENKVINDHDLKAVTDE